MPTLSQSSAGQSFVSVIHASEQICSLPAIPTQDWASSVADALRYLAPSLVVGVLIAHIDPDTMSITPVSAGVAMNQSDPHAISRSGPRSETSGSVNQSLYLQDKLERISALGFELPDGAFTRGLVAPISLLHPHWASTPIGRILAAQHYHRPILAIVPITEKHPGFVLMITLAFENNLTSTNAPTAESESIDLMTEILASLVPLIANKAQIALEQVTNPKAWLTEREHEILDQLILGHSVRVIANNLGRSAHTVHDHVKNLHKKLGASSRGELIAKALGYRPTPARSLAGPSGPHAGPIVLMGSSRLAELKPSPALHARPLRHTSSDHKS